MQLTLRFLLLMFPLIAACLAVFDWPGLVIGLALAGAAVYASKTKTRARVGLGAILVLGLGFPALLPAVGDARRAARRLAVMNNMRSVFYPGLSAVAVGFRNYQDRCGALPSVQERDSRGQTRHSWRALILDELAQQGCRVSELHYNRDEAWDGPHNRNITDEHFLKTGCFAIVDEDGNWLRPTPGSNPVRLIQVRHPSIPWIEPRDLTVEEACEAIHVPMPSGSLARRLLAAEALCVPAVLADGKEVQIPVHTPPAILRAALAGDPTKQFELPTYRDISHRLRWFDYLTLIGMLACWIGMTHACGRGHSIQSIDAIGESAVPREVQGS